MKLVFSNCPVEVSKELAKSLVTQKLAACVNISQPIQSIYVWEGDVCQEEECTLIIKCAAERVPDLLTALTAQHPYDVPEILVVDVDLEHSHRPYVDWVRAESAPIQ